MNLAFLSVFGSPAGGYFSDVILGLLCADARAAGYPARLLRVFYDGESAAGDAAVSERLEEWLVSRRIDVAVVDRLPIAAPLARWKMRRRNARVLLTPSAEGVGAAEVADLAFMSSPYEDRRARHTVPGDDLRRSFAAWLAARDTPGDWADIPGLCEVVEGAVLRPRYPLSAARQDEPLSYEPVLEPEVIAARGEAPEMLYTVYGNSGCPYGRDVAQAAPYRALPLAREGPQLLRRGCSFCTMGGDYEKRPDKDVIASLLAHVGYLTRRLPGPHRFVLGDQNPLPYLPALLRGAGEAGLGHVTWLLQSRADTLVEERARLEEAIAMARETGARLELYLIGFESFSDEELERYNKGVAVATLLGAVRVARELARSHGEVFGYARYRGHSLILFNPWTRPANLLQSALTLREQGLGDFFHDITRNRIRLYPHLPMTVWARQDGLVAETWDGDRASATARQKGYNLDIPWRFADGRTAAAYELCSLLKEELGGETEIAQLVSAARWAAAQSQTAPPPPDEARAQLQLQLRDLATSLDALLQSPLGTGEEAAVVAFAGACNNHCASCENRDVHLDEDRVALFARVDGARQTGLPIVLAGREPTLHPELIAVVKRAAGTDGRRVAVVTNGRRFAYSAFARACAGAGLWGASVKLFGTRAEEADAVAEVEGAHAQSLAGIQNLIAVGVTIELRLQLHASAWAHIEEAAALARQLELAAIRVEAPLGGTGLEKLADCARAIERLRVACRAAGVRLVGTSLRRGMRDFSHLPVGALS